MKLIPFPLRRRMLISALVGYVAVLPTLVRCETATAVGNSRSIQMNVASGYVTGLGPVYTYVTTYDGYPGVSLYQDLPSGVLFSGELRPRVGVGGLYEADFATYDSDGYLQDYGSFTANLPTTDSDGNGLPDVAQTNKPGNASVSGTAVSDYYGTVSTISGSLQRPANSSVGTYSVKLTAPGASAITYSGSLYLFSLTGSADYSRATGVISLTLTEALPQGGTRLITGSTSFVVVNVNQIFLQQFNVSSSDGHNYTVLASTFSRSGNKYISNVALADGLPETSWPDYVNWVVEITDANDSNGNGIPNLSDQIQPTPTPTPTVAPTLAIIDPSRDDLTNNSGSSNTYGWVFTVGASDLRLSALGVWDDGQNGLAAAHLVGIWNSSGELICTVTVQAGALTPLVGEFRMQALSTQVTLSKGATYTIGALYQGDDPFYGSFGSPPTVSPEITSSEARFTFGTTLEQPTDAPDPGAGFAPYVGPNFQFTAVTPTPTPTPAESYIITVIAAPASGGTVAGAGNYNAATLVTVTAIPATGYKFKKWTENGQILSKTASYTFTAASNRTLTAQFKRKRR